MISVFAIILHYKNLDFTKDCLRSLRRVQKTSPEVDLKIVIVDSSKDQEVKNLGKGLIKDVEVICTAKNLGYAGGNNLGIKFALEKRAGFIWILNNDIELDSECLQALLKIAHSDPKIGILSPKIYFFPGFEFHGDRYRRQDIGRVIWWAGGLIDWNNVTSIHQGLDVVDDGQFDNPRTVEVVTGTAMLVRSEVFRETGLFDENLFLYYEESDFCLRARARGWQLWYVPGAIVWHKNAGSSGVGSGLHDYYLSRNQMIFGFRYAPWKSKFALLRQSLRLLIHGRPWQRVGIRDSFLHRFGRGSFVES